MTTFQKRQTRNTVGITTSPSLKTTEKRVVGEIWNPTTSLQLDPIPEFRNRDSIRLTPISDMIYYEQSRYDTTSPFFEYKQEKRVVCELVRQVYGGQISSDRKDP